MIVREKAGCVRSTSTGDVVLTSLYKISVLVPVPPPDLKTKTSQTPTEITTEIRETPTVIPMGIKETQGVEKVLMILGVVSE